MSRGLKIYAMSIVLATFAPLILLTLWAKNKVGPRWHRVVRTAGYHLSTHRDQSTREVTLYEKFSQERCRGKGGTSDPGRAFSLRVSQAIGEPADRVMASYNLRQGNQKRAFDNTGIHRFLA